MFQATPGQVTGFTSRDGKDEDGTITQLDMGAAHIVFLAMSGNVYLSGMMKDSDSGMWRNPDPRNEHSAADKYGVKGCHETPVHIPELKNTIAVFAGDSFCAALNADRELYTWGKCILQGACVLASLEICPFSPVGVTYYNRIWKQW